MMKIGRFLQLVALIMLAAGAQPAMSAFWQWSAVANNNATADPTINWAEGMSPSSVNDSARAMMAALAIRGRDQGGLQTGGTTSALTLTTNTGYPNLAALSGQMLTFIHGPSGNAAGATLNVDGIGPLPIYNNFTPIPADYLTSAGVYSVVCYSATSQCRLVDSYANTFGVPLGAVIWSTLATPPNGNFAIANGQCLSTTTYASYWTSLASPAPGVCPAGNFQLVDLRGRVIAGLDTLPGSGAAGRLTSSSTGCGTTMTAVFSVCSNGLEGSVIPLAQLPTGITSANAAQSISVNPSTGFAPVTTGSISDTTFVTGSGHVPASTGTWGSTNLFSGSNSISVTSNNTSGTARPSVQPTMGLIPFVRVI
jgi:hypothetical protein